MQRDDHSPSTSPVVAASTSAAGNFTAAPGPTPYDLGIDMVKRNNNNSNHAPSGSIAGNASSGLHQHGLSSGANVVDAAAIRKARFVSDSNIPNVIGMGFASSQNQPQMMSPSNPYGNPASQHQHSQSSAAAVASALAAAGGAGNSNINGNTFGDANGNGRSFSGTLNNGPSLAGTVPPLSGTPFSPIATNAAAYPAATGPLNMPNSVNNFATTSGGVGAPFLSTSPMYPSFSPNAFSPPGGFMGGVGLISHAGGPGAPQQPSGRTVYVGNLPADASIDELLNLVKFGPIENVKILPEKSCAFFSFLDGQTAAAFHADASVKKLSLHGQELKIGWGKPSAVPPTIMMAVQQNAATRNVYVQLGQDDGMTEEDLRDALSKFGPIDQVKIVRDKNIGFVHFLSISTAMKVVSQLPHEPEWQGRRVNYGKDRCAYVPKSQQQNQAHNNQAAAMGMAAAASLGYPTAFGLGAPPPGAGAGGFGGNSPNAHSTSPGAGGLSPLGGDGSIAQSALQQLGNRTIYLGNIHPETTTEEICNHIRGGILQTVRYIPDKHIAFVTFVDANSALAFHHWASYSGIMIHNRRLKIGWGKHSGPLSPAIAMAVQAGASRNVYVGNIENPDELSEDKLRRDFSEHGDVELVNSLREKNCAFVNFCNIQNAIKAIEAMKSHLDYQNVKISHGKDRCGRTMQLNGGGGGGGGLGGGMRKPSGSVSPNPPRSTSSSVPRGAAVDGMKSPSGVDGEGVANGTSSNGAAGGSTESQSLSASSSAYDMPPIDSSKGGLSPASGELTAAPTEVQ